MCGVSLHTVIIQSDNVIVDVICFQENNNENKILTDLIMSWTD